MTKCQSDGRGGEGALEVQLVDHVLDGVADSPALGIAGRVTAGAGLPGRTEILRVSIWGGHWPSGAPFRCTHRLRAPDQEGVRMGVNLLVGNRRGSRIA